MGMTIDDNVDFLNEAKDFFEDVVNDPEIKETIKTYLVIESLETAIETMRKYQKIVNIVSLNDEEFKQCGLKELKEILEVIADGND